MSKDKVLKHHIVSILMHHGESLLCDEAVDFEVCEKVADEIISNLAVQKVLKDGDQAKIKRNKADRDEVMVELGYMAGADGLSREDSRAMMSEFCKWGEEFQLIHTKTDWHDVDYMTEIENFYNKKKSEAIADGWIMQHPRPAPKSFTHEEIKRAFEEAPAGVWLKPSPSKAWWEKYIVPILKKIDDNKSLTKEQTPEQEREVVLEFVATLPDPDAVGQSEYREIYELIKDCDSLGLAYSILEEFCRNARETKLAMENFILTK